jgi:LPXTG-motif cell wall-anchored protein
MPAPLALARWTAAALLATGLITLATPAAAAPGDPSLSIVSVGPAVAVATDLTIGALRVQNNTPAAISGVEVRFELIKAAPPDPFPFGFLSTQRDTACRRASTSVVQCSYPVQVAAGATADIAVALRLAPNTQSRSAPTPSLSITVGTDLDVDTTTVAIDRVKRVADLSVRLAATPKGRIGDVVDVGWIVRNQGPDAALSLAITLTAPSGTEWTGSAAAACDPPTVPKTQYRCRSNGALPAGQELAETWQLKIVSATVGTGDITVAIPVVSTPDPYLDITDTNLANNAVALNVEIDTSPKPSDSPDPTAAPSASSGSGDGGDQGPGGQPAPGGGEPLPRTGSNVILVGTAGTATLLAGLGLLFVARRKGFRFRTTVA